MSMFAKMLSLEKQSMKTASGETATQDKGWPSEDPLHISKKNQSLHLTCHVDLGSLSQVHWSFQATSDL